MERFELGCVFFSNDLRVYDNSCLASAARECKTLACVYLEAKDDFKRQFGINESDLRRQFRSESLCALNTELKRFGQRIDRLVVKSKSEICSYLDELNPNVIYRSWEPKQSADNDWAAIEKAYPEIDFKEEFTSTLFDESQLPFESNHFPGTFSKFRRAVEHLAIKDPVASPSSLPPPVGKPKHWQIKFKPADCLFNGGEREGKKHLDEYFAGQHASSYKQTRNALDGWKNSTKFSVWLSNGCLSVRQTFHDLKKYELAAGANESTYWIYFELLWREYFQWYAKIYSSTLTKFSGHSNRSPMTFFNPQRFKKWCSANTPFPLVNACMSQLNAEGYMSNRGRQIVASCLVNELSLDWRFGAAYFAQKLIDYDFASNWGNWQYIAGVGTDPRGGRHLNLSKQRAVYDPHFTFINSWQGERCDQYLDSADIVDWPITHR
jgi:deoxyribodipyrimidine photo-lyase